MHKKIFSNAGYLAGASLIEKIGAFIIIPLLTASLTAEDYGSLMLAVSYVGVVILFIYNGLHSALFRWYSMWEESFDKRVYEKYIYLIINAIGISLILFLLLIETQVYELEELLRLDFSLFITTLGSSLLMVGYNLKSSVWIVEGRAYKNLVFVLLKSILLVSGVYFFIEFYPYAITKPLIEVGILFLLSSFFIYNYFLNYPALSSVKFSQMRPLLKDSFIYGWGLQISQLAFWVITSSDRIMLANLTNNEYVAYYSILMIGISVMFVVVAFNNSFSAYYNKMMQEKISMEQINAYVFTYLIYGFFALLVYKIALYFFAEKIILFLSTQEYLVVSHLIYLTSDIILFYFAYLLFSRYLHALKMVKHIIIITILSAIINITLNYFFILEYGVVGALMASIMAYVSMSSITLFMMVKNIEFVYMKKIVALFIAIFIINSIIDITLYRGLL